MVIVSNNELITEITEIKIYSKCFRSFISCSEALPKASRRIVGCL